MTTTAVPVESLRHYHKNPRKGNVTAISDSLAELGQYRPLTVNRGTYTGRPNEVLAGNHTLKAAKALGYTTVMASFVDVDDDTAARIVVADNRTSDLGTYDNDALADLLGELPDLVGTGYTDDDVTDLLILAEAGQDDFVANIPTAEDPEGGAEGGEDRWEVASRKTIILGLSLPRFIWATETLNTLSKTYGTKSNADTLKRLLEDAK
jgi:hypothetical protein